MNKLGDFRDQNDQSSFFTEDLWAFALRYYQAPGIEKACLTLQNDFSGNVLLLLWSKWLDQQQLLVNTLIIDANTYQNISNYIELQSERILLPLRHAREKLKESSVLTPAQKQQQKEKILSEELALEKELLMFLQRETASYGDNLRCRGENHCGGQSLQYTQIYLASLHMDEALQIVFAEPFY